MATTINYDSMTSAVVNYLKANRSSIDSGIYSSITSIGMYDPLDISLWCTKTPAISVNLIDTEETKNSINSYNYSNDTSCMLRYEIGCHIRDIKSFSALVIDMQKVVTNVASVLRSDMTLSNSADYLTVDGVRFNETIVTDRKTYNKSAIINLTVHKYF